MIDPFLPAPLTSQTSILEFWTGLFNSFPDLRQNVDEMVVSAGKAFVAFTTNGVGKGSLGGRNVDGKRVEIQEGYLLQLDDRGLVARLTIFLDTAKLSKQLSA
jgi:predicted ester cyclase